MPREKSEHYLLIDELTNSIIGYDKDFSPWLFVHTLDDLTGTSTYRQLQSTLSEAASHNYVLMLLIVSELFTIME